MLKQAFPYPGSKSAKVYRDLVKASLDLSEALGQTLTAIAQPFAGSGAIAFGHKDLVHFLADNDPWIFGLWATVACPFDHRDLISGFEAGYDLAARQDNWEAVKDLLEVPNNSPYHAGLAFFARKVAYGNILRTNKQGRLNVSPSQDKLKAVYSFDLEKWLTEMQKLYFSLYQDWKGCLKAVPWPEKTLAFIDPPYYVPEGYFCTPCYPGHKPYSFDTLRLEIDSVDYACSRGFSKILTFGYFSEARYNLLKAVASTRSYRLEEALVRSLSSVGNKNKGRLKDAQRVDIRLKPEEVAYVLTSL